MKYDKATPPTRDGWLIRKFPGSDKAAKVFRIVLVSGFNCFLLGCAWCIYYAFMGRFDLAMLFASLSAIGIACLQMVRRTNLRPAPVIAHGLFMIVALIALIDSPTADVPRTVHLFFLPLAVGSSFVFEAGRRYMGNGFPVLCLMAFGWFAFTGPSGVDAELSPPPSVREIGGAINVVTSIVLLGIILDIYRKDLISRIPLVRDLGIAISRNQLRVYYQPQVDAQGQIFGAEALVRWQHPERGLLTPEKFIPLAEESGLIGELGNWVLAESCRQLKQWESDPQLSQVRLSVNVSSIQLSSGDFSNVVADILAQTGASPRRLMLELTESALASDLGAVRSTMENIRSLGVEWALDDFGTGFSSLSVLRSLTLAKIKIDKHFVHDAARSESGRQLLAKILEIARVMRMTALAEGVEDESQKTMLIEMGCAQFQGYLFGRPQTLEQFEANFA